MPTISNKGARMPASPIRKLVPFAENAKRNGIKVYHLNIGQPDIYTPTTAMEAIKRLEMPVIEYSHSAGFESYRKKLVEYYVQFNIRIEPDEIMVTTGGSEAILFGLMSCLDAGDELIIPEPFYANYNGFATAADIIVKPIHSDIETGFALPPIKEFKKVITDKTKAIMICNPNNPTGYLYSKEELEDLRKIILEQDLYLFADEVYREFAYDGREHHSVLELEGLEENVVVMDSISKRYSACGARVGALITRNKEVYATAMKFAQARLSPPTLGQVIAEAAIDTDKMYFTDVINQYVQRRDLVVNALNNMEGVFCPNPGGAFYCIARLPVDDADKFCQWLLSDFSQNNETVMMAPGSGFYATPGHGSNEVRIAYVLKKESLQKAMEILAIALMEYPGRKVNPLVEEMSNKAYE